MGFELISLDGRKSILSHVEIKSPYRVGKYKVNIQGFESFLDSIPFSNPESRLIIIDEIGKMECFSDRFKTWLQNGLESEKSVIATIALKGTGFIEAVKKRQDARLFEMTQRNRDSLLNDILREVRNLV